MSLRRASSTSINDTACIDFKEGFLQSRAAEAPNVIDTLRGEIAELKSKLEKPVQVEKPASVAETALDAPMKQRIHLHERHNSSGEHSHRPRSSHGSREHKKRQELGLPFEVMDKISALESHVAKQQVQAKSDAIAQNVLAKLGDLESRLHSTKPDASVLSKLHSIESNVSQNVMAKLEKLEGQLSIAAKPTDSISKEVMAKLDKLEGKLSAAKPADAEVMSKLRTIESKLELDDKYQSARHKLGALLSHLQSEQSIKNAVHDKLAMLEEHVKLKTGAPLLALEKNYHQELEHLDKLERLRARVAAVH